LRLTILGPPNAGKSSLINALARRDIAIVSDTPGTTRDVIEARLDLGGYLLLIADTAGVRDTKEPIEAEGVRRALIHAAGGMTLLLLDGAAQNPRNGLPSDLPEPDLTVWNKSDLGFARDGLCISLKTGEGVSELVKMLQQKVQHKLQSGAPPLTRPASSPRLGRSAGSSATWPHRPRLSSRIAGGRFAAGDACHRADHRPGGCGRAAGLRVPRFLHRQVRLRED
jgi:tRNA modification GTPase